MHNVNHLSGSFLVLCNGPEVLAGKDLGSTHMQVGATRRIENMITVLAPVHVDSQLSALTEDDEENKVEEDTSNWKPLLTFQEQVTLISAKSA